VYEGKARNLEACTPGSAVKLRAEMISFVKQTTAHAAQLVPAAEKVFDSLWRNTKLPPCN
jgi:hypothetical protein